MSYVDGYVIPVPSDKKQAYSDFAKVAAPIFKEHGALQVVECWGDEVPEGEVTSFPAAVKLSKDETVVFSWILWPSKEVRDGGLKKAMGDPRMQAFEDSLPFDGKRLIMGGFDTILEE